MKKKLMTMMIAGGLLISVTACSAVGNTAVATGTTATVTAASGSSTSTGSSKSTTGSTSGTTSSSASGTTSSSTVAVAASDMFTDRDKDASYDESTAAKINLSSITDSSYTISKEGTYILSGTYTGQIIVDVADTEKVQLVLDGVNITNKTDAAIYIKSGDKVFVTLKSGTKNTLTTSGTFVSSGTDNVDGVIFSKADLTLNGTGSLTISSTAHGIVSKDDLVITGGTYSITSVSKGISGKDSVRIADGTITIKAGTDGIHSENEEDLAKGFIYIGGGTITINAADDGIHANTRLNIAEGKINIASSVEGIEAQTVNISGGEVKVVSSDDGINATTPTSTVGNSTETPSVNISGGKVYVNAEGDGVDSNGNLFVSGGETYVSGPTRQGNGGLDYDGTAKITGGTFIITAVQGMDMNFGSESTQGSMLVNVSNQSKGTKVTISDSKGNVLATYTPDKAYSSLLISTAGMVKGETYTITAGSYTQEVTLDSLISGSGSGMGGGRGGMGGRRGAMGSTEGSTDSTTGDSLWRGGKSNGMMPPTDAEDGQMMPPPDAEEGQTGRGKGFNGERRRRGWNNDSTTNSSGTDSSTTTPTVPKAPSTAGSGA